MLYLIFSAQDFPYLGDLCAFETGQNIHGHS